MEWVETTAKSVEEAKEMAVDQLGVLEDDAEFEVVEEPKAGLFGRTRGNARVRARIAPTEPPPKQERRRRNGRNRSKGGQDKGSGGQGASAADGNSSKRSAGGDRVAKDPDSPKGGGSRAKKGGGRSSNDSSRDDRSGGRGQNEGGDREMMPEAEQRKAGEEFLDGLLAAMGFEGSVASAMSEDGILSFDIEGESLGLMIGPGLNTLDAVQEVCRNAIQRQADGRGYGKVSVDVEGVRSDRTDALQAFVRTEAQEVLDTGEDVVFEVMSRGDRKIVHDVVGEFDDLATESVGEDPRRRVVLKRA